MMDRYRIIDLSHEIVPGERKVTGSYLHGEPVFGRSVEVEEFFAYGARMHFIQGQTHTGTHAEAPYKYADNGIDLARMPLESFIGEAVACNFTSKAEGEAVDPKDFQALRVRAGDIVLAWGDPTQKEHPHLADAAIDWLIGTKIKALAVENLEYCPPGTPYGQGFGDARLMRGGIAIVDAIHGLDQITQPRVFFIALPLRMRRVTASWTRAVALEPID